MLRVATRYEETARNFLAFVHVAAIMVLVLWADLVSCPDIVHTP